MWWSFTIDPLLATVVEYQYVDSRGLYIAFWSFKRINHVVKHIDTPPCLLAGWGGREVGVYHETPPSLIPGGGGNNSFLNESRD